jgi:IPT/TIG domain
MLFKRALAFATASVIAAAGSVAAVALSAGPAAAAVGGTVALPFSTYSQMLVDPVHHHLFLTGGPAASSILVTDYSGQTVATISGEPGASGLTLSGDGSTVYAALAAGDAISAISTSTLTETARYATGTGTDPTYVAYTSGKIWFGYGAPGSHGAIGSVDPAMSPATVTLNAVNDPATSWYGAPELKASPAGDLVAGQPQTSPLQLASYNVSTGSAVVLSSEAFLSNYAGLTGLQITPDGNDVVVATGGGTAGAPVFAISSLALVGSYPSGAYTGAVAIAGNGTVAAGSGTGNSQQVSLFAPGGTTPLAAYSFSAQGLVDLAFTPDASELFAVTVTVSVSGGRQPTVTRHYTLNIISSPVPTPAPAVTGVSPASGPTAGGNTVTITGTGFTNASAVSFGPAAATSFTVSSDTQITATAPPGAAGAVDVLVTVPATGSSTSSAADQYTYLAPVCTTTVTGTSSKQLTVASGLTCLVNATQNGQVTVEAGAALTVTNSTVNGTVTATDPGAITYCGATEHGALSVTGPTSGPIILGGPLPGGAACAADTIPSAVTVTGATTPVTVSGLQQNGTLTLENDSAGITLGGSHVSGRANVDSNTAPLTAQITVSGNTVTGSLYCTGNSPAPVDAGTVNTVSGTASGQCAAIAQR